MRSNNQGLIVFLIAMLISIVVAVVGTFRADLQRQAAVQHQTIERFELPPLPVDPGEERYATLCITCHGDKGQGDRVQGSPALYRLSDWYVVAQLTKFKEGIRGADPADTTAAKMVPMAQALATEQDMQDVADYIRTLPGAPLTKEVVGNVTRGAETYRTICAQCHGDDAAGMLEFRSSTLAGQNDWYLLDQLKKFKSGMRGADLREVYGAHMRAMAMILPDEQTMKDVVAYIATLP